MGTDVVTVVGTNFGNAAADYGTYRADFPACLFERLLEFKIGLVGQVIADLGTGTGTLARSLAKQGCTVTGVDIDPRMLAQAKVLDSKAGVQITYREAHAEYTGLSSGVFDVVTAGQCWHWFDRPQAVSEVTRLLKQTGKLAIAHFDWLPLAGSVVAATESLIEKFNPDWHLGGGNGKYPRWIPDLQVGGFQDIQTFHYDLNVPYSAEAWCGRIRASAGVVALDDTDLMQFDSELADLLAADFPDDELAVPHRVYGIVACSPAA